MPAEVVPIDARRRRRAIPVAEKDDPGGVRAEAGMGCVFVVFETPEGERELVLDLRAGTRLREQLDGALETAERLGRDDGL